MERIAIVSPVRPTPSETFINAHLHRLPFEIHHCYSLPGMGFHPIFDGRGKSLSIAFKPWYYFETALDNILGRSGAGYFLRKSNLRKYFRQNGIAAVLAEYGPTGAHLADVCDSLGIPLIVHFHGRDAYHYVTLDRYARRYRRMFNLAYRVIAVSQDMRRQLISLGAPESKVMVNPYGPNPELFAPVESNEASGPVFLFVGRLTGKKAPVSLIRAFGLAVQEVPAARLIIAGTGELETACHAEVDALGLTDEVQFRGLVTPVQVADLHRIARVYIQHSVRAEDGDSEGTPVAILEAMASGLPVISTRHAGIPDVVIEGETGLLVDEHDVDGMSRHIVKLALEPDIARQMGRAGAQRIQSFYTMERHLRTLEQTIHAGIASSLDRTATQKSPREADPEYQK